MSSISASRTPGKSLGETRAVAFGSINSRWKTTNQSTPGSKPATYALEQCGARWRWNAFAPLTIDRRGNKVIARKDYLRPGSVYSVGAVGVVCFGTSEGFALWTFPPILK